MLLTIEGGNFVGKTSTLDRLKKNRKNWIFTYHPRWNAAEYYDFSYNKGQDAIESRVHKDIVTQISHATCLKYLQSVPKKHIIVQDRNFCSEKVYNIDHNRAVYDEFCDIFKEHFDYKIFYLYVSKDEELIRRIEKRYNDDIKKKFGCVKTDSSEAQHKDDIIKERFNLQRELHGRYLNLWLTFPEDRVTMIDTASIKQGEVARIILNSTK